MAYEFKLPDLGEGVREGEIARWLVEVGQEVPKTTRSSRSRRTRRRSKFRRPPREVGQILVGEGRSSP